MRTRILAKFQNQCAVCSADGLAVPLEVAFLRAISSGGEAVEENLIPLCSNCHRSFDSAPREIEFTSFLAELLQGSPDFDSVRSDALIGTSVHFRADLLAERKSATGREKLLIECKRSPATIGRLHDVVAQIKRYQQAYGKSTTVLAIPATLPEQDKRLLAINGVELWDLDFIATSFRAEIAQSDRGYYKLLLQTHVVRSSANSIEQTFIQKLQMTQPGPRDWSVYQSLIGDILEYLFCPTLVKPLCEHSDATKANRRDFIMPNHSSVSSLLVIQHGVIRVEIGIPRRRQRAFMGILLPKGVDSVCGLNFCRVPTHSGRHVLPITCS